MKAMHGRTENKPSSNCHWETEYRRVFRLTAKVPVTRNAAMPTAAATAASTAERR